jgi:hypothetical protein
MPLETMVIHPLFVHQPSLAIISAYQRIISASSAHHQAMSSSYE